MTLRRYEVTDFEWSVIKRWAEDSRYRGAVPQYWKEPQFNDKEFFNWVMSYFPLYFHDPNGYVQRMLDTCDPVIASWAAQKQWSVDARAVDQTKGLGQIRAAALIIAGGSDLITPVPVAERFHAGIRNSRLEVIENCGHFPWIEQPAHFFERVSSFVRSAPRMVS